MSNCVNLRKSFGLLALISAVFLLSLPAFPQGNTDASWGTVTDQSGGYVANATVTVTDVARGVFADIVDRPDGF